MCREQRKSMHTSRWVYVCVCVRALTGPGAAIIIDR